MNSEGAQLWMDELKIHGIRTAPASLKLTYIVRNFGNSHGWVHHKPTMIFIGDSLPEERSLDQTETPEISFGTVAICVGIEFGALSSVTRLSDHAARSMI
jgi:hypothetical protein